MFKHAMLIIVLMMSTYNIGDAHKEWVHQYMVKEAYKLLELQVGVIPELRNHMGMDFFGPGDNADPWGTGFISVAAWREDMEDVIWGKGTIFSEWTPSATHFWNADEPNHYRENSLEWLPDARSKKKGLSDLRIVALERMVPDFHEKLEGDTELNSKFSARIKGGLKFSENGSPGTEEGWWFSLGIRVPLSSFWSIEGEFLYWRSPSRFPVVKEVISMNGYSLFLSYSHPISKSTGIIFFIGPGLAQSSKKRSEHPDFSAETTGGLVTLDAGLAAITAISQELYLVAEIRQQRAATPSVGGGDHYTPVAVRNWCPDRYTTNASLKVQ